MQYSILGRSDSQAVIEQLENSNMFIFPLDDERQWYRYHHLFADLLKLHLLLKGHDAIKNLQKKACDWFEQHKEYHLAIEHAISSENYSKSLELITYLLEELWENGQHAAIMEYGKKIPDEHILQNPEFCLYYSWVLIAAGKGKKAEPYLKKAEKEAKLKIENQLEHPQPLDNKKLLGKIAGCNGLFILKQGIFG